MGWCRGEIAAALVLCAAVLGGCASLPTDHLRTETHADIDTSGTRLGQAAVSLTDEHPGLAGIYLIERGVDAFAARVLLADAAERTLDLQYFLWHRDTTGRFLAHAVLRAADRGVRVRVLLDDVGTTANDSDLLLLDAHPNIEVRLFNPIANRTMRTLSFLVDFARANRRMHNKSFTADNQVAILGGRNVADEYFEASAEIDFGDRDLVVIGPVVPEVSSQFDRYWNSDAAFPIAALGGAPPRQDDVTHARSELQAFVQAQHGSVYADAVRGSAIVADLASGALPLRWGPAHVLYDDPAKIATDPADRATHLAPKLRPMLDGARDEVILVSPYFVPGDEGVAVLREMRERGIRVKVLTNSLASTDVLAVHSGYQRYRRPLLEAGVELYELAPTARRRDPARDDDDEHWWSQAVRSALHAKTMIFDRRAVYLGSMNLDPRSLRINAEIGATLENPEIARALADQFDRAVAANAYRLVLVLDGAEQGIEWVRGDTRYTSEPLTSAWQRFKVWLLSLLPIESLL